MAPENADPTAHTERAHALYGSYRQTGWALSATIVGFATVLLAWSLPDRSAAQPQPRLFYWQAISALVTIAIAFVQQISYYHGGKHLARRLFHPQSSKQSSDRWFLFADGCAIAASVMLLVTVLLSTLLWWSRVVSLDGRCGRVAQAFFEGAKGDSTGHSLIRTAGFYSPVIDSCVSTAVADVGVFAEIRDLSQSLLRDPGKTVLLHCDTGGVDSVKVDRVRQHAGKVWEVPYAEWLDDGFGGPPRALKTPEKPFTRDQCRAVFEKWIRYLRSGV